MKRQLSVFMAPFQGGRMGSGIALEIMDEASGTKVVDIKLSHEEFGRIISTQGLTVEGVVGDALHLIGKRREIKNVELNIERPIAVNAEEAAKVIADHCKPHKVDGWVADIPQFQRSQKGVGPSGGVLVPFYRYVDDTK